MAVDDARTYITRGSDPGAQRLRPIPAATTMRQVNIRLAAGWSRQVGFDNGDEHVQDSPLKCLNCANLESSGDDIPG